MAKKLLWEGFPGRLTALIGDLEQWDVVELVHTRAGAKMNQSRVSTLSRGLAKPTLQEVEVLAISFGVDPGWLAFDGERGSVAAAAMPEHPPTRKTTKRKVLTPAQKAAAARRTNREKGGA